VTVLGEQGPLHTIYDRSENGRRAAQLPTLDVPEVDPASVLPAELLRGAAPRLPEVSEPDLVRHYVRLSELNFSIDTGFYPLGSCTMKHNPKINERVAALPGFAHLHPLQEDEAAQGTLEVLWRLQGFLASIAGLPHVTLQPAAGAQGELCGLLLMRAYHESRSDPRRTVVIPDTAHGTNPASVTMAGYDTVKVKTDARGGVDLDDLRAKVDENVAGLMLTNPSTTGLFDENIAEIAKIFHDVGALVYYDGANLNAVMGVSRPGDMGFDIVHFNTHKSFSTPHGGGGPGAGPVAVTEALERFLPKPVLRRRDDGTLWLEDDRPDSIGKLKSYVGNTGVLVRAYTYIRSNGADGIRDAAETAVLNANYLLARLKHAYDLPFDRLCKHEFVLSARKLKREHDVKALDVAKRLMDFGFHPPTIYFPLLVPEALMVEPTETENKETLDAFAEAMLQIAKEAAEQPQLVREAPHVTRVKRLDEVRAAKNPVVRQELGEPSPA
jgi:glycine dehydrogenase subunit 2